MIDDTGRYQPSREDIFDHYLIDLLGLLGLEINVSDVGVPLLLCCFSKTEIRINNLFNKIQNSTPFNNN